MAGAPSPVWWLVLAIPVAGLALLLRVPSLDVHWEHHPSHFWLVLGIAAMNVALGLIVSEAARRSRDERLFLVSMVLLTTAGFLALHALATPGVVLNGPNGGFVLATPVGLFLASGFAALSATDIEPHEEAVVVGAADAARSPAGDLRVGGRFAPRGPALGSGVRHRTCAVAAGATPFGIVAYAFAAWRYLRIYRVRRRPLPLAVATSFVLLAEALVAIAFSRAWQVSWWEWHLLMAVAFATILLAARPSTAGPFPSGSVRRLYLERTLERLDRRGRRRWPTFATRRRRGPSTRPPSCCHRGVHRRRDRGDDGLGARAHPAGRAPPPVRRTAARGAPRTRIPRWPDLGGREREVSILFADLAGFTSFAEGRPATEVIEMLNAYWGEVVPPWSTAKAG